MAPRRDSLLGPKPLPGVRATYAQMLSMAMMLSLGVGIMALPSEIAATGTVPYAIMFVCVVSGMNWSMLALLRAKAAVEERGIKVLSYRDLGYDFLGGDHGARAVDWCVVGFQFGVCASYFSFMTSTLHTLWPHGPSQSAFTVVLVPIVSIPCTLKHLRDLGVVAQFATVTYAFALGTVGFFAIHRLVVKGHVYNTAPFSGSPWGLIGLLGSLCYAFEGIPSTLCQMANALQEPDRASELVTTSLLGLAVIFTATGYVCTFAYQDPQNPITVSLIDEFGVTGFPAAANWLVVISVALKFPMQFFPMAQQLEHALELDRIVKKDETQSLLGEQTFIGERDGDRWSVAFRAMLVVLAALTALVVNDLTTIINVVGIVFGPSLGFIFPCYFDLICVRRRAYDRSKIEVAISIVVLCCAIGATFLGFGQQVVGLVRVYVNGSDDDS